MIIKPILYMASTTAKTPANSPVEGATSPPAAFEGDAVAAAETTAEEALQTGLYQHISTQGGRLAYLDLTLLAALEMVAAIDEVAA